MLHCISIILISILISESSGEVNFLPYSEFVSQVKEGKVKKVKIGNYDNIYGYYNIDGEKSFYTDYKISTDVLLLDLLKSHNVTIVPKEEKKFRPPVLPFLPFFIPFINLILIIFLIWKNIRLNKKLLKFIMKEDNI